MKKNLIIAFLLVLVFGMGWRMTPAIGATPATVTWQCSYYGTDQLFIETLDLPTTADTRKKRLDICLEYGADYFVYGYGSANNSLPVTTAVEFYDQQYQIWWND